MAIGLAMLIATLAVAFCAVVIAVCAVLVGLLYNHPIALAITAAFMMWLFAVALIYFAGGTP